jgi:hypothetical protein
MSFSNVIKALLCDRLMCQKPSYLKLPPLFENKAEAVFICFMLPLTFCERI